MADADEENPPEEGGEEEAAEEGGEAEVEEGEEGSKESSFTSSQYASASGGSRSSQFSEGSRSLSVDIELLSHELRELKDFLGVQYERLFQAAKQRRIADLPKALTLAEEKEELLERLQNPDLIALLKQTFKRAERGNFAPRQFQKVTDYLQILKNQSPKFEDYLCELSEAIASIEDIIKKKEKEAEEEVVKEEEEEAEDEEKEGEEECEKEEMPEELIKYKVILEERTEKLNSVNNFLIRYLIEESCLDSYIVELDLARAFAFVREQSSHIEKLLDYIDLQRKHMDPDSPAYEEWSSIGTEKEHLGHKVEQRSKKVTEMRNYYINQEEDDRDQTVARLMRKDMDELIRSQSLYIQKLRSCIEAQAPYVYEDDDIPDTTEISAESTYISKYVDEWLMFNGMEFKNQSQAESELELLTRLKEQLERFIAELSSELEEIGGALPPSAAPAEAGGEEAGEGDGEEGGEGGGEGEAGEEEQGEGEAQAPGAAGGGDGKGEESLVGWVLDIEIRKKYLAKMIQQLSAALNTIEKNRQIIERRAIYGEKKVPKKRRQMPKMSELGSVESLNMPDTVSELKEFSKNLVQKYNCLFKVYALRLQLNEEKRRQERLRNQIDRIIESTHLQKKGDFFQMQLKNAWATVAALQDKLRENRRKALDKCETLQNKIDKALGKIEHMQNEVGEFQAKLAAKVVVVADPATAQRK